MSLKGKIEIAITVIIMVLVVLFTNIISVENQSLLIQYPNLSYIPEFLNTDLFVEIVFLLFIFLFPFLILTNNNTKKRYR